MSKVTTDIILFDLDGTLVESTPSVEQTWRDYHEKYGINITNLYEKTHGVRTVDNFTRHFPEMAQHANGDIKQAALNFDQHIVDVNGHLSKPIDGAVELLKALNDSKCGNQKWCICTSGSPGLAYGWFEKVLPIDKPKVFVTAADVKNGKPNPEPYLKGADLLATELGHETPEKLRTIVFEDAPAGIKAGKAAGAVVVGILSSFEKSVLEEAGADYIVPDLTKVKVLENDAKGIVLEISS